MDSRGRVEMHRIPFVVADLRRYKMCLGLGWIDQCNPKISFASRRLLFRGAKVKDQGQFQKVAIEDAKQFESSMRDPKVDVYRCLVNFVGTSAAVGVHVDQTGPVSAHSCLTLATGGPCWYPQSRLAPPNVLKLRIACAKAFVSSRR
jgi:hypothetical protein